MCQSPHFRTRVCVNVMLYVFNVFFLVLSTLLSPVLVQCRRKHTYSQGINCLLNSLSLDAFDSLSASGRLCTVPSGRHAVQREHFFEYEGGRLDDWDQQMLAFGVLHAPSRILAPYLLRCHSTSLYAFIFDIWNEICSVLPPLSIALINLLSLNTEVRLYFWVTGCACVSPVPCSLLLVGAVLAVAAIRIGDRVATRFK